MAKSIILLCTLLYAFATYGEDECTPSKWGADDQIGNLNLMSADSVLAAASPHQRR